MSQWTLGEVKLSQRVSIKIELDCGGQLEPSDVLKIARLLDWIGRATRKWQSSIRAVTPSAKPRTKAEEEPHAETV